MWLKNIFKRNVNVERCGERRNGETLPLLIKHWGPSPLKHHLILWDNNIKEKIRTLYNISRGSTYLSFLASTSEIIRNYLTILTSAWLLKLIISCEFSRGACRGDISTAKWNCMHETSKFTCVNRKKWVACHKNIS